MGREGRRRTGWKALRQRFVARLSRLLARFQRRPAEPPPLIGKLNYPVGTALQKVFDTEDEAVLGDDLQRLMLHLSHVETAPPQRVESDRRLRGARLPKRGLR